MEKKVYTPEEMEKLAEQARTQMATLEMLKRLRADKALILKTAQLYVTLNREWQIARYGKVRQHLTAAKLAVIHS